MDEITKEQEQAMQEAFALLEFKRLVDEQYLSGLLLDLAEMTDNPIKRAQLERLGEVAFDLEEGYL